MIEGYQVLSAAVPTRCISIASDSLLFRVTS